jgi:RNA processing factor Prp31
MTYNTDITELTETVLGKAIIDRIAEKVEVASDQIKDMILSDYNGEMCKEFVRVVRDVIQSREELQDFVETEMDLVRAL